MSLQLGERRGHRIEGVALVGAVTAHRSRFIAEAVQHELDRRRRHALLQSGSNPHAETAELVDTGLAEWTSDLPDDDGLVDPTGGTAGVGALYPALSPGSSGLTKPSCALIDHRRSIDKRRVRRVFGRVSPTELAAIDTGLELFLGLGTAP